MKKAEALSHELEQSKLKTEEYFDELFPPIVEERWSEKTGKRLKDKVTRFNPGSRKQIAQRLPLQVWMDSALDRERQPKGR